MNTLSHKVFRDWRPLLIMTGGAYVWHLILFLLSGRITPGMTAFIAWVPLLFAPIWALWVSTRLLQRFLADENRAALSLPRALREILSNLAAILVQVLIYSALVSLGSVMLFRTVLGVAGLVEILPIPSVEWFAGFFVRAYVLMLIGTMLLAAVAHLAYLFGRFVERYNWLLSLWVFVIVCWLGVRLVPVWGIWLGWLPGFSFEEVYVVGGVYEFREFLVDSGPFLALALFGVAVTLASSFILSGTNVGERANLDGSTHKTPSTGGV